MLVSSYVADGSVQICYVGKGSGRIKVVGSEGKPALHNKVEEGDLFIVPQFYALGEIADDCGLPVFGHLAGNTSVVLICKPGISS
ncbi:putative rmlC-like cupin domain superfamily, rmlC-like jelly roll protein [Helianthus anomalus]